ncbi:hypothetical protein R2R35_01920 [Anaerocolumna sp. AGMB13020]|uniref:hypothetical protein n=1 Tax=Anaerocolumna sp. AGMB13020 TaxID=3081750 RepID=UPI002952E39E|nr:hypothetical protein [Anaerocolumna sp. AGMB13020]WOO37275.1 hypothetical protein R2R35_01920 [Anaerocolumna sp. AGMB13020]
MYEMELIVFAASVYLTIRFIRRWYQMVFGSWIPERGRITRYVLGWLPVVALVIIYFALKVLASFDVVNSSFYIQFYLMIGYAFLSLGLMMMAYFWDISWKDDCFNLQNKAAVFTVSGGFLGLSFIYSGANLGDGPGWWTVLIAGGLGLIVWILIGIFFCIYAQVSERVTIDRDINTGIRYGLFLLASGIILGRASAGDWTSFYMTLVEFMDGWPVLPLTLFAFLIEKYYSKKTEAGDERDNRSVLTTSIAIGLLYIIIAIITVLVLPAPNENPIYGS